MTPHELKDAAHIVVFYQQKVRETSSEEHLEYYRLKLNDAKEVLIGLWKRQG